MKFHGDIERVNLNTGETHQRVAGDGESRIVSSDDRGRLGPRRDVVFGPDQYSGPTAEEIVRQAQRILDLREQQRQERIAMSEAVIRCKMRVQQVTRSLNEKGEDDSETITLGAVYGNTEENKQWSKWTPSASFNITINNKAAFGKLSKGHEFFVDFIPCPAPEPVTA